MKKSADFLVIILISSLIFFCFLSSAMGQSGYPNRPIEVIIPALPGSPAENVIRYFGEKWSELLGQPVVPVHKPGGAMTIGTRLAATAKPDGYTLLCGADSPLTTAVYGRKDIGYNIDSFRYLFSLTKGIVWFSVRADSKWKTMDEFLADAKQNPGKLKYATWGRGSSAHFLTTILANAAGVNLTMVPYKVSSESLTALLGGHVDMAVTPGMVGMADSPLIRLIALTDEERLSRFPNVPTLKELGYPVVYSYLMFLCAPKGISEEVVNKLVNVHRKVWAKYQKDANEKLPIMELYPVLYDGETLLKQLVEKDKKFRPIASKLGIKLE